MKKILILGSGHVAAPAIKYLHEQAEFQIIVASNDAKSAADLQKQYSGINTVIFDVHLEELRHQLVASADIVVSLLPAALHSIIAFDCLKYKKDLVTASYTSPDMMNIKNKVKTAGLIFLNECGLDPGLDHMSAMKIIDRLHRDGARVLQFKSYCGGLPSPEANTNLLGYKFSWNPKGVLLAAMQDAAYLWHGEVKNIPGKSLLLNRWMLQIPFVGEFEYYPNRDSLAYKQVYKLKDAHTIFRGTLRYPGWCETLHALYQLGFNHIAVKNELQEKTVAEITAGLVGCDVDELESAVPAKLGLPEDSIILQRLKWLGLFENEHIHIQPLSLFNLLVKLMQNRMSYGENEKDMILLEHDLLLRERDGQLKRILSKLVNYGKPDGFSAMAKTVGYPLAIATELVLNREFSQPGVHIPTLAEIYMPILKKLETVGIKVQETKTTIVQDE